METDTRKILVGGIQKFSTDDGPGIRTTVFLKGCPLNCRWCHNPELISPQQQIIRMPNSCIRCGYCIEHCPQGGIFVNSEGEVDIDRARCKMCMTCVNGCYAEALRAVAKPMSAKEVMYEVEKDAEFYAGTGGGMTISGGELLMHHEFAKELVTLALERGINVCLDTSGCGDGDALEELALMVNVTDILYDMKCIDRDRHKELTGLYNDVILENLSRLASLEPVRPKLHMRMPLIKGLNDDTELISRTAEFYSEHGLSRVTLLPYHRLGVTKMKHIGGSQETFSPPSDERIEEIRALFESIGMHVEVSSISQK